MTTEQREAIIAHGKRLQEVFPATRELDPLTLCKRLRRLEAEATHLAERNCNGEISDDVWESRTAHILTTLDRLTSYRAAGVPCLINGDPRGYALKIDEAWMRSHPDCRLPRDWGDYGIIAPEIGPDGR